MDSTVEIMNRGINCLIEKLGIVEAEHFISVIIREQSDYTKWQREYFDHMSLDEINDAAVDYGKTQKNM